MKPNIVRRLLSAFAVSLALASSAAAAELQVVVSGKYYGTVDAYVVGHDYYLDAKKAGGIYGGQVYWYPVTGRVQMSIRGRQAQFMVNSSEARVDDRTLKLALPVLARSSDAYIPLSFLMSKDFSDLAGMDTQFQAETGLLSVDRRTSVGPVRWFSYDGYTQIVLEIDKSVRWSTSQRGRGGFEVTVPFGKIDWSESVGIDDGLVGGLRLAQDPRAARMAVRLEGGAQWEARELDAPRRLVIDVFRDRKAMMAALRRNSTNGSSPSGRTFVGGGDLAAKMKAGVRGGARVAVTPLTPGATAQSASEDHDNETAEVEASSSSKAVGAAAPSRPAAPVQPAVQAPAPEAPATGPGHRLRIVVDAGHGGKDSGATGRHRTREKDINLLAARELASLLKEDGFFDVLLVRDNDTFVPLDERSQRANTFNADLFVSLHCNAASSRNENGFEIYFLSEQASDPESQRVADVENSVLRLEGKSAEEEEAAGLLRAMAKTEFINEASELAGLMAKDLSRRVDLADRGVKQAAFYVLRGTNAPAVLVEMGFVTNSKDEAKLGSKRFRRRLIEGVYTGILDYAQRHGWNKSRGT